MAKRPAFLVWLFAAPVRDLMGGLERALDGRFSRFLLVACGLLLGWWIYVPLHELLHAAGCAVTGGAVSRLEIDPLYGGALLARLFSFVVAGGHYAGRLSGFDTHGNDLIYLATDLAPFLLCLFPGVWFLRRMARRGQAIFFGFALPFGLAPFLSLTGDAYEMGSILVTRLPLWSGPGWSHLLRGDDLVLIASGVLSRPSLIAVAGLLLATLLGIVWAFLWYASAGWLAARLGERPLEERAAA